MNNELHKVIANYQELIKINNRDENVIFIILEKLTGKFRTELLMCDNLDVDFALVDEYVKRYIGGESIQYILNNSYFLGRDFYVDNRVLIPRFETEEVTLRAIDIINKNSFKKICDLCCGSGVIGISIALECEVNVVCSDISDDAIEVAKINVQKYGADVEVISSDLLANVPRDIEMIVSNPPYISRDGFVDEETFANEPHLALYANNDGMEFYQRIIEESKSFYNLKYIVFEIGFDQREKLEKFCNATFFQDINGNDRIAIIEVNNEKFKN